MSVYPIWPTLSASEQKALRSARINGGYVDPKQCTKVALVTLRHRGLLSDALVESRGYLVTDLGVQITPSTFDDARHSLTMFDDHYPEDMQVDTVLRHIALVEIDELSPMECRTKLLEFKRLAINALSKLNEPPKL